MDVDAECAFDWCCESLSKIAHKAEEEGSFWPWNHKISHICNQASKLAHVLKTLASPCLKGLADTDVIATTGVNTFSSFINVIGSSNLGHVHFVVGKPGRHLALGGGTLDLDTTLEKLNAINHAGPLGLEILDRQYVFEPNKALTVVSTFFRKFGLQSLE